MYILAYDLGTGGVKAALYRENLSRAAEYFVEYPTFFPGPGMHEQRPEDWWDAVVKSTQFLLETFGVRADEIAGAALSGASLIAIPLDAEGRPLLDRVPIWSDSRAETQAKEFFRSIPESEWYLTTGNGFPPACYSIFKLMWMREHQPDVFRNMTHSIGSKDYINYRLTGRLSTDTSYASGTGAFDLENGRMRTDYLQAAGLKADTFLSPLPSHEPAGRITSGASAATGLPEGTPVFTGGVDNACMALGAVGPEEGRAYVSLGTSAWIPVNARHPVLDVKTRPYTFAHIEPGMFTSAYSLFAGGNSLRWGRDVLFPELAKDTAYDTMSYLAGECPPGANGVLFYPGLAGGTMQDPSPHLRGAFMNLELASGRNDLLRAIMEGVAMNLGSSLELLKKKAEVQEPVLFCGGGSRSAVWMQIFADILNVSVEKTDVDQSAASLGAAAIAARGLGLIPDYSVIPSVHSGRVLYHPNPENAAVYRRILPYFETVRKAAAELGDRIHSNWKGAST